MVHDTEFPSDWDMMSDTERTAWLAKWFDANVAEHRRVGKMNRERAKREWEAYRSKNGIGKRRK